jgi:hypothetical protein
MSDIQRASRAKRSGWWAVLVVFGLVLLQVFSQPYIRATWHEALGNNVQAYRWYRIAGTPNGLARVARQMTPDQIAEAERLARGQVAQPKP